MNKEQVLRAIEGSYTVLSEEVISNGISLKLNNGGIINCFSNGNHNVQGKNVQEIKAVLEGSRVPNKKKIFVVYGHDDIARTQLEAMLRRWDLEPIILDQQVSELS